jgi:hypothetical protein
MNLKVLTWPLECRSAVREIGTGGVAPSHLPDRRPPQNEERGLT